MEAVAVQCRQGAATQANHALSLHPPVKSVNPARKNERKAGEWSMAQRVVLRMDLNENDLLLLIRWMSNEHVYRFLNEHQQIKTSTTPDYLCSRRCSTGTAAFT